MKPEKQGEQRKGEHLTEPSAPQLFQVPSGVGKEEVAADIHETSQEKCREEVVQREKEESKSNQLPVLKRK